MFNRVCAFILLCFAHFYVCAQHTHRSYLEDKVSYREHPLDITRMKVEVAFDASKGRVIGKVTHSYKVLQQQVDSVFFDAPQINIKTAALNGTALNFTTVPTGVWVKPTTPLKWDQTGNIAFEYEATPRKGIYFIGWNVPENPEKNPFAVRKQIWTQGQGIDNRYWIPMYDDMNDKFITETVVTFDKDYHVLSNGVLKKKTSNKDNTITWHYSMSKPHAGYLLMLGIGKYEVKTSKSGRGVPMNFYYYPEFADRMEPTYRYSEMMVDFLERETGIQYPWESYSQIMVQDFLYGAMENTTATIFGDFFNVDARAYIDRNYVGVNCHELTHQWFGDFITARDSRDTWLQESFATYYPKQLNQVLNGEDDYNWQRRGEYLSALDAGKKDRNPIRHSEAGSARFYPKGSAVISMLAYVLGEEQWKRALNHYLKTHAYGNVETNDMIQAIQDVLGKDLSWFFDQWIYRGGEPEYTVHYEDLAYTNGSRATEIAIEQTHVQDEQVRLFKMPVVLEVHYTDGSSDRVTDWIDEQFEVVKVPNKGNKQIAFVLFDPNARILKSVRFKKELHELIAQLDKAPYMLDRYDALYAMRDMAIDQKREVLLACWSKETFVHMKAEIMYQLVNDSKSAATLQQIFNTSRNQAAKLNAIKQYNGTDAGWKAAFTKALSDSSYDVVQAALEKLCTMYPQEAATFLQPTKGVQGMNNSVRIKWLELAASHNIDKQKCLDSLVWLAGNQWEFRTRNHAFSSLKTLNYCNEVLVANLFDAMLNTNSRLAAPAQQLSDYLCVQSANKQLFVRYFKSRSWEKWQVELLKKQLSFL